MRCRWHLFLCPLNIWGFSYIKQLYCYICWLHALSLKAQLHRLICKFFWWSTEDGVRHSWVSGERLFRPTGEGGLGLRKLENIHAAYSYHLWWRYHAQHSLWSNFFCSLYGNRPTLDWRITDSSVWKLICGVHSFCMTHSSINTGISDGKYLLRTVYDQIWLVGIWQLSLQFVWHKLLPPNIRLFLWRLYHEALPILDYLARFVIIFPSHCPFCLTAVETQDHIFLGCPKWWMSTQARSLKGRLRIIPHL